MKRLHLKLLPKRRLHQLLMRKAWMLYHLKRKLLKMLHLLPERRQKKLPQRVKLSLKKKLLPH
jgi:hypothetical protein